MIGIAIILVVILGTQLLGATAVRTWGGLLFVVAIGGLMVAIAESMATRRK